MSRVRNGEITQEVKVLSRDGKSSLGIEYVEINIEGSKTMILVSHGQQRTLDQKSVDQWRTWGTEWGLSILLHNYPGYGNTPGPVTEDRIMADLEKLVEMLKAKSWEEEQICLLGNSAGCGPTIALAAREKYRFKKVVLISAYTSCVAWGPNWTSFMRGSRFDVFVSTKAMDKLRDRQVLMVCGKADTVIPYSNSEELFRLLGKYSKNHEKNRLCTLPKGNHVYTRLKAMKAIAYFVNDETHLLDQELQALEEGVSLETRNSYLD
ncbi:uncharacterized protein LAJ45_01227 [Morchella importuna]|uniref:uncharacterized protein n=1 Tax=Morchella importuna TaxID=1174673 RepID=UPI001E8E5EC1|nr:uncharacterized protein LAJ45_01227 [Morchella importuna]KAH8154696.1 hypothetical protein LAJ45_01227 [Morchella importuna]